MAAKRIGKKFFARDAREVAKDLLGKIIVRKQKGKELRARIIEVEAYLSEADETAKENYRHSKRFGKMWDYPGIVFTYSVHGRVMFCIVTKEKGIPEAVFLRALESIEGGLRLDGPGILTKNLEIDKLLDGCYIDGIPDLWIEESDFEDFEIVEAERIGLKEKNPLPLRFYIKGNAHISRK